MVQPTGSVLMWRYQNELTKERVPNQEEKYGKERKSQLIKFLENKNRGQLTKRAVNLRCRQRVKMGTAAVAASKKEKFTKENKEDQRSKQNGCLLLPLMWVPNFMGGRMLEDAEAMS